MRYFSFCASAEEKPNVASVPHLIESSTFYSKQILSLFPNLIAFVETIFCIAFATIASTKWKFRWMWWIDGIEKINIIYFWDEKNRIEMVWDIIFTSDASRMCHDCVRF